MKRNATLKRGRLPATNRRRRKAKHARNFGNEADAVRRMPCLVCGAHAEACHVTARGMGGAKGGRFDLVPLCRTHHQEAGEAETSQRAAFEREHGLDLRAEADHIAASHEPPLGIRGAACVVDGGHAELLSPYERRALHDWVARAGRWP